MTLQISKSAGELRPSVFATLAQRLKQLPPDHLPLHIGDTFRQPPEPARLHSISWSEHPNLYKYSHPFGLGDFLELLAQKIQQKNKIPLGVDSLQVSCGATGGLASAAQTVLNPGEECLILSPYWPLITGIMRTVGAVPVQVPFTSRWSAEAEFDPVATLSRARTSATRALYFSNPNNPDGWVYTPEQLQVLADFAVKHDLWVLSDEAYEDYLYDGRNHTSIASLPGMAERTITVFTFSKSYAMAGLRIGYVVAPEAIAGQLRRVSNHQIYNLSGAVQMAAMKAVQHGEKFLQESRELYQPARDALFEVCRDYCTLPGGGGYLFLSMQSRDRAWEIIDKALDRSLCLAPGEAFGEEFAHCLRVCFTSARLEGVQRGARILAELL